MDVASPGEIPNNLDGEWREHAKVSECPSGLDGFVVQYGYSEHHAYTKNGQQVWDRCRARLIRKSTGYTVWDSMQYMSQRAIEAKVRKAVKEQREIEGLRAPSAAQPPPRAS